MDWKKVNRLKRQFKEIDKLIKQYDELGKKSPLDAQIVAMVDVLKNRRIKIAEWLKSMGIPTTPP